jgi:Uma2 family endonuclease
MATLLEKTQPKNLGQLLKRLGVPPERILLQPPPGMAKERDVVALLDAADKRLVELIDGVLVEKTMGWRESLLAMLIGRYLLEFVEKKDLGIVLGADGPVRLRRGRVGMPDVCFVLWDKVDKESLNRDILNSIPDLAVEVISKGNTRQEMRDKLRDYFKAGVRLVWFLYEKKRKAVVHQSRTKKRVVEIDGKLDGGDVLPGFSLPLKKLFSWIDRCRDRRS